MRKPGSRRSIYKTMIVVATSLALGTAMTATATIAFARGDGAGHFGGFGAGHFGCGSFGGGRFSGRSFGRDFGRRYGFGGDGFYYGGGYSGCYVLTPYGYAWACY